MARPLSPRAAAALLVCAALPALADDKVTDQKAQAMAQQVLDDYRLERDRNKPRWSTLAFDDGSGSRVDCPTTETSRIQPVSFKDCNLAAFELAQERWQDVLQSWAVLSASQKSALAPQLAALFAGLDEFKATSMGSQAVRKGYEGGGLLGLMAALGITPDQSTEHTVQAMLEGSFLAATPEAYTGIVRFNSSDDVKDQAALAEAHNAQFKGSDGQGFDAARLLNDAQLNRQATLVEKGRLEATTFVASNSRARADAVRQITGKIQALGRSPEDASLVSAQLAQYEFFLAALDALGREEQIKAGLQRQGEAAEERLKAVAMQASRAERNLQRAQSRPGPR